MLLLLPSHPHPTHHSSNPPSSVGASVARSVDRWVHWVARRRLGWWVCGSVDWLALREEEHPDVEVHSKLRRLCHGGASGRGGASYNGLNQGAERPKVRIIRTWSLG